MQTVVTVCKATLFFPPNSLLRAFMACNTGKRSTSVLTSVWSSQHYVIVSAQIKWSCLWLHSCCLKIQIRNKKLRASLSCLRRWWCFLEALAVCYTHWILVINNSITVRNPWWLRGYNEPHTAEAELCSMLKGRQLLDHRKWGDKRDRRLRNVIYTKGLPNMRLTAHHLCKTAMSEFGLKCKQAFNSILTANTNICM